MSAGRSFDVLPPDPILGSIHRFRSDPRTTKSDLAVGQYRDQRGLTPVMRAVREAESDLVREQTTKEYLGQRGDVPFLESVAALILGQQFADDEARRIASFQTVGGSGALRVAGELARRRGCVRVWLSQPSWSNHAGIFQACSLETPGYPYCHGESVAVEVDALLEVLGKLGSEDAMVVQAGGHNPSGLDLRGEHWEQLVRLARQRGVSLIVDVAYLGLCKGLEADVASVRSVALQLPRTMLAVSFSKSLGLYRERVGALLSVEESKADADAVISHAQDITRAMYSMPPAHGAEIARRVLSSELLRSRWLAELDEMRVRLDDIRARLSARLPECPATVRLGSGSGMFASLDLSERHAEWLERVHGVYVGPNGRISVPGIREDNFEVVVRGLAEALTKSFA